MVVGNAVCYKLVHFFILPRTSLNQIWCIGAKICLLLKLNTSWVIFASITCVRQNSMIIDILQTAKDISCPVKVMSAINSMADFISSWSGPFLYRPLMPSGCYPPILFYLPCTDNFYNLSTTSPSSLILGMINLSIAWLSLCFILERSWGALFSVVCESVWHRCHPTKYPLFPIYTGIQALCWPCTT